MKLFVFIITAVAALVLVCCNIPSTVIESYTVEKSIAAIVDSFTTINKDRAFYEMYIDKIRPDSVEIHLYAGDLPLTTDENDRYDQWPTMYVMSNEVKLYVYSGLERYITSGNRKERPVQTVLKRPRILSAYWIITDSKGTVSVEDLRGKSYPYLPMLKKASVQFIPPDIDQDSTSR